MLPHSLMMRFVQHNAQKHHQQAYLQVAQLAEVRHPHTSSKNAVFANLAELQVAILVVFVVARVMSMLVPNVEKFTITNDIRELFSLWCYGNI